MNSRLAVGAVDYLIFYAFCSICLPLPIVYAAYFGHFKGYDSFFEDDDRSSVLYTITIQISTSLAIAFCAIKFHLKCLAFGLVFLVSITCKAVFDENWLLFDAFDCNDTGCSFYGFSMLTYFATGKFF